jgi:hypothetical protein
MPGTANGANALGEMLLTQSRSAYQAKLMVASATPTSWAICTLAPESACTSVEREFKKGELTVLRRPNEKRTRGESVLE